MPKLPKLVIVLFILGISFSSLEAKVMILNGLAHEKIVSTGQQYNEFVEIYNGSDKAETVLIYQKDYRFLYTGESFYDDPGTIDRSNASWIRTNQKNLVLQPGETINVAVQVNVPSDASLKGTYWSLIMVEKVDPPDPFEKKGFQIRSVIRYGIQIITHIGSTGIREINFAGTSIFREDSLLYLQVFIENTGERMLRHTVGIEMFSLDGKKAGQLEAQLTRTFPGTSTASNLDISAIPPGNYNIVLIADCENEDIFGTNMMLEIPLEKSLADKNVQPVTVNKPDIAKENDLDIKSKAELALWGIQLGFSKKKPARNEYSKLPGVIICKCADGYRIFGATANNPQELEAALVKAKNAGYRNAWINKIDQSQCNCN